MSPFEIQFLKILDRLSLKDTRLVVSCSGGLDSMALLQLMAKTATRRNIRFQVVYFHHGPSELEAQNKYRDSAGQFVMERANELGVEGQVLRWNGQPLRSESELRHARRSALESHCQSNGFSGVLTAHHRDDLFETRFMRLMRGVGPQGIRAISSRSGLWLRPLLSVWREELEDYVQVQELHYLDDPSNADTAFLRNRMRRELFPVLESVHPGALKNLAVGLEALVPKKDLSLSAWIEDRGIRRGPLVSLSVFDQRRVIASYLMQQKVEGFTSGHIEEILKRLDTPRSEFTFKCAGRNWSIDTRHIRVES